MEDYSLQSRDVFDLLGRNVLHYAVCYGDHNNGISWILIQNQHLFDKTDVFGCGFISYAVLSPNFYHLQFNCPWVEFREFLNCFYPNFVEKEPPDLNWIIWFSGQKVGRLNQMLCSKSQDITFDSIRSEFKEEITAFFGGDSQIQKFSKLIKTGPAIIPTDLIGAAMRGDSDIMRLVFQFINFMIKYLDSPGKFLQAFEIAMTISGEAHVKVALQVYSKVNKPIVTRQMLDIIARNQFSLFKKCIEFISDGSEIESDLWFHCKDQEKELFNIATTTKFITFRRALNGMDQRGKNSRLVDAFLKICDKRKDENIRKELMEIVRGDNDKAFETAFRLQNFSSDLLWKFLPIVDREQVLENHYDTLTKNVISKIKANSDPSHKLAKFLSKICFSVGPEWQNKIQNDVQVDLKAYGGNSLRGMLQKIF